MKSYVADLQYCFDRYFRMQSEHVVLLGDLTYRKTTDDKVFGFEDDLKARLHILFNVLQHVRYYRKIDLNKDLVNEKAQGVLSLYCSTRDEVGFKKELGKLNHLYKAKHADLKLRNKFYKTLGLKCIHSESSHKQKKPKKI